MSRHAWHAVQYNFHLDTSDFAPTLPVKKGDLIIGSKLIVFNDLDSVLNFFDIIPCVHWRALELGINESRKEIFYIFLTIILESVNSGCLQTRYLSTVECLCPQFINIAHIIKRHTCTYVFTVYFLSVLLTVKHVTYIIPCDYE